MLVNVRAAGVREGAVGEEEEEGKVLGFRLNPLALRVQASGRDHRRLVSEGRSGTGADEER